MNKQMNFTVRTENAIWTYNPTTRKLRCIGDTNRKKEKDKASPSMFWEQTQGRFQDFFFISKYFYWYENEREQALKEIATNYFNYCEATNTTAKISIREAAKVSYPHDGTGYIE